MVEQHTFQPLTAEQKFEFTTWVRELLNNNRPLDFTDSSRSFDLGETTATVIEMDYGFLHEVSLAVARETTDAIERCQYSVDVDAFLTHKYEIVTPKDLDRGQPNTAKLARFTRTAHRRYKEGLNGFVQADYAGVMATLALAACREQAAS